MNAKVVWWHSGPAMFGALFLILISDIHVRAQNRISNEESQALKELQLPDSTSESSDRYRATSPTNNEEQIELLMDSLKEYQLNEELPTAEPKTSRAAAAEDGTVELLRDTVREFEERGMASTSDASALSTTANKQESDVVAYSVMALFAIVALYFGLRSVLEERRQNVRRPSLSDVAEGSETIEEFKKRHEEWRKSDSKPPFA
jgi:hypothetical protein